MEPSQEAEWEIISDKNDDVSVFPPMNHENLRPQPAEDQDSTPSREYVSDAESDVAVEKAAGNNEAVGRLVKLRLEIVRSKVLFIASRIRSSYVVSGSGFWTFWSAASVTGLAVAAAVVFYTVQRRRRRAWKEKEHGWKQLLQEKDERISELLLQIAEMKEKLMVPRMVPVFRVIAQNCFKY